MFHFLKSLLFVVPFACFAQGWQLSVVDRGMVDGVQIMSIAPPFSDDMAAYHFAANRPCATPQCAVLFIRPDAPLPAGFPLSGDEYMQVMAYKVEAWDWQITAFRCFAPIALPGSFFPCLDFPQLNKDFQDWRRRTFIAPRPTWQDMWHILHRPSFTRS